MILAIIPARGGSKRIPKKNIKLFAGRPMISYSIQAAIQTGIFDDVIVSTDSPEIAQMAIHYGANVPFMRPVKLADDFATTADVLLHTINYLNDQGKKIDFFCCIYATAPFIRPSDIIKGYETLRSENTTSVFTVTTFPYPIFRALKIEENGTISMFWPEYINVRSNDLPEAYHDAGQFYWANAVKFYDAKSLFAKDSLPIILPRYIVQDIDTMEDWENAERIYAALNTGLVPNRK
jgi:pseudaminic acid cytidylyltransferase